MNRPAKIDTAPAEDYIRDLELTRERVAQFKADRMGLTLDEFKAGLKAKEADPKAAWPQTKPIE